MHMGIFYYVINLGVLLLFSLWYMKIYWLDKEYDGFLNDMDKEG